jgi:hypothetical protein
MRPRTHCSGQPPPVSLHHDRGAARIARLVAGAAIYTAAALMLFS